MVNVDTVYQKVLALANKEQRGYITPQEFDLFADKAQLEIINDYFHNLKMAQLKPKNQTEASDEIAMLMEKMSYIRNVRTSAAITVDSTDDKATVNFPDDVYMIATVFTAHDFDTDGTQTYEGGHEVVEVEKPKLLAMLKNPLTRPTNKRPVYYRRESTISNNTNTQIITVEIYPGSIDATTVEIDYWKKPDKPKWGYVVVDNKALYNFNTTTHFELHPSEEELLVTKILLFAGITIEKPGLMQAAMVNQQTTKQNQNS